MRDVPRAFDFVEPMTIRRPLAPHLFFVDEDFGVDEVVIGTRDLDGQDDDGTGRVVAIGPFRSTCRRRSMNGQNRSASTGVPTAFA